MKILYDFVAIYDKKHPFCPKLYSVYNKVLTRPTDYHVSYLNCKKVVVVYFDVELEGKIVKLDDLFYNLELTYSSFPDLPFVYPTRKSGFKRYDLVPL